jgi:hypothetical protein
MAWVWYLEAAAQWRAERAASLRDLLGQAIALLAGASAEGGLPSVPLLRVIENPVSPDQAAANRAALGEALRDSRSAGWPAVREAAA